MAKTSHVITNSETDKGVYADGEAYRLWYQKKDGTLRLKLYGTDNVYYVEKNSKMYNDLLRDFFSNEIK